LPKIIYKDIKLQPASYALVKTCNEIIAEYQAQGFTLTLRQLYYQLVSRDIIANKQTEYKRLGSIVNDARLTGMIDWLAIEDRTRELRSITRWESPADIIDAVAAQFHIDLWKGQKYRPEVWIEKDALVGVIEGVCNELDVPHFSCRGYTSQSEMWVGAMRLKKHVNHGQIPIIFHLGDHDPSGKDMTRDIFDRMQMFMGGTKLERLALNMEQVEKYNPPPNPAKLTDSRCAGYIAEFGDESWELDALEPSVIAALIRTNVMALVNKKLFKERLTERKNYRATLKLAADRWSEVEELVTEVQP
jgi:hypothetical protein